MTPCEHIEPLLDDLLDQDISPLDELRIREHLATCAACTTELALAERIQRALRSLPRLPCPDALSAAALAHAAAEIEPEPAPPRVETLTRWRPRLRRAIPLAAAAAVLIALAGLRDLRQAPVPPEFSPAQIAQAAEDVRWALAYVTDTHLRAGHALRDEVIGNVVAPVARATDQAL
jgi:anti-sigma factor RsiW